MLGYCVFPQTLEGHVDLAVLLKKLSQLGIASLMVEGGAHIITSFLSERLVDHIVLTISPMLIGGMHAICPSGWLSSFFPLRLYNLRYQRLEEDLVLWGDPIWE